jgi:hypothetical protein
MASKDRFSISMDPQLREALRQHAETAGLDVSAYISCAVARQIEEDNRIAARFATIDAENTAAETATPPADWELVTEEEAAAFGVGISAALAKLHREHAA